MLRCSLTKVGAARASCGSHYNERMKSLIAIRLLAFRLAAAVLLVSLSQVAGAEVSESVDFIYYDAPVSSGQSLLDALNGASKIRQNGRTYHGYTKWNVRWNFWWREGRNNCRITRVKTTVASTITMPRIIGGTNAQKREFERFSAALKEHELGHAAIGKEAADAIDRAIRALPEMQDCGALERAANGKGNELIREYQEKEKRYDADTRHGREQGAWLER
jgi:predicted secreted Zn-dependent protease